MCPSHNMGMHHRSGRYPSHVLLEDDIRTPSVSAALASLRRHIASGLCVVRQTGYGRAECHPHKVCTVVTNNFNTLSIFFIAQNITKEKTEERNFIMKYKHLKYIISTQLCLMHVNNCWRSVLGCASLIEHDCYMPLNGTKIYVRLLDKCVFSQNLVSHSEVGKHITKIRT